MLKAVLAYVDRITTYGGTYAGEIQTGEYGEDLEDHLRYHSDKLRGIVNGIDYDMWNPETNPALAENYGLGSVLERKMANKLAFQRELDLEEDKGKFVIGLIFFRHNAGDVLSSYVQDFSFPPIVCVFRYTPFFTPMLYWHPAVSAFSNQFFPLL